MVAVFFFFTLLLEALSVTEPEDWPAGIVTCPGVPLSV